MHTEYEGWSECTDALLESDDSDEIHQSENRMHAQTAIMLNCMGADPRV